MKKVIIVSVICAAGVIGCGKKIVPGAEANNQSKIASDKSAKSVSQTADQNNSATATPSFNNMQKSVAPPMESSRNVSMEKGKTVFVTKCVGCHALKSPGDYTTDQWNNILQNEIPKARLDNNEADQVTAYILANAKK